MALNLSGAYYNHALGLISLSNGDGNWITIADKNLGATNTTFGDEGNCGKLFQRGNCYGFTADYANDKITGYTSTTTSIPAHTGGPGSYNSSVLIYTNGGLSDNKDLWGGVTGTYEAMRGPCDEGWHIPTLTEYEKFCELAKQSPYTESDTRRSMSLNGVRYKRVNALSDDTLPAIGGAFPTTSALFWLSTVSGSTLGGDYGSNFSAIYSTGSTSTRGASLLPIRPFKNVPVEPDSTWDKIYGDDAPDPKYNGTLVYFRDKDGKSIKDIFTVNNAPNRGVETYGEYLDRILQGWREYDGRSYTNLYYVITTLLGSATREVQETDVDTYGVAFGDYHYLGIRYGDKPVYKVKKIVNNGKEYSFDIDYPSGGTDGQALTKTSTGIGWTSPSPGVSGSGVKNVWTGTKSEFNSIPNKDNNTLYFIKEDFYL